MAAKLYSGGGDLVDHSRVSASQGSLPAGGPHHRAWNQLSRVMPVPTAKMNPPIVEMRLRLSQPRPLAYVATRLGIPRNPRMCIPKNAVLKPTNISQKLMWPQRSLSRRPDIFGYQK